MEVDQAACFWVQIWPEDVFPMRRVGRLMLTQNIGNFFNENEQLAFSPGHIIPGAAWQQFFHHEQPRECPWHM